MNEIVKLLVLFLEVVPVAFLYSFCIYDIQLSCNDLESTSMEGFPQIISRYQLVWS